MSDRFHVVESYVLQPEDKQQSCKFDDNQLQSTALL